MTKTILRIIILLAATILTSCADEQLPASAEQQAEQANNTVCLRAGTAGNETRTETQSDADKIIKTIWTAGDEIHVVLIDNDKKTILPIFKFVKRIEDNPEQAVFKAKLTDTQMQLIHKDGIKIRAIVKTADQQQKVSDTQGESNFKVDGLDKQDGSLANLAQYDILYSDSEVNSGDAEIKGNNILMKFHHLGNVVHLTFKTSKHKDETIERLQFNYVPSIEGKKSDKDYRYEMKGIFLKDFEIINWTNSLQLDENNNIRHSSVVKPGYIRKFYNPRKQSGWVFSNELELNFDQGHPLKFNDEGKAEVYILSFYNYFVGRLAVQARTKEGSIMSQNILLDVNSEKHTYGSVIEGEVDIDHDNAIGMYLHNDGTYGPMLRKGIASDKDLESEAIIISNTVSRIVLEKSLKDFQPGETSDYEQGYRHYAMSLLSYVVNGLNISDENIKKIWDRNIFPKRHILNNNNGRQYTAYLKENAVKQDYSFDAISQLNELNEDFKGRVSEAFIPSTGQLYSAMCNLCVNLYNNKYSAIKYNCLSYKNDNLINIVNFGTDGKSEDLELISGSLALQLAINNTFRIKPEVYPPLVLGLEINQYIIASNAFFSGRDYGLYTLKYTTNPYFLEFNNSDLYWTYISVAKETVDPQASSGNFVPFYAVKPYTQWRTK